MLTGESVPVSKDAAKVCGEKAPLGDRRNMAYSATAVVAGQAEAIVVGTGDAAEIGQISRMVNTVRGGGGVAGASAPGGLGGRLEGRLQSRTPHGRAAGQVRTASPSAALGLPTIPRAMALACMRPALPVTRRAPNARTPMHACRLRRSRTT